MATRPAIAISRTLLFLPFFVFSIRIRPFPRSFAVIYPSLRNSFVLEREVLPRLPRRNDIYGNFPISGLGARESRGYPDDSALRFDTSHLTKARKRSELQRDAWTKGANGKSDATEGRRRILTIIGSRLSANKTEQSVKWSGSVRERFADHVRTPTAGWKCLVSRHEKL